MNRVRCVGLAADISLELGDLPRAMTLIAQAEAASRLPFAAQTTAPRRARHSRLAGHLDEAERHLTSVAYLEGSGGLTRNGSST